MKLVKWENGVVILLLSLLIVSGCSKKVATIKGSSPSEKDVQTKVEVDSTMSGAPEEMITEPMAALKSDIDEKEIEVSDGSYGSGSDSDMTGEDTILAKADSALQTSEPKDVFFQFDLATLSEKEIEIIKMNAEWIKKNRSAVIRIEGYADERGTSEYNLALGEKRAQIIRKYLTVFGVSQKQVDTLSFGEEKNFCSDHNEACWAQNRRGHFVVVER